MKITSKIFSRFSEVKKYRWKMVFFIALFWTITDIVVVLLFNRLRTQDAFTGMLVRESIVFIMSIFMGYLLVFILRQLFRNFYLWVALLCKSMILVGAAFCINLLLYAVNSISLLGRPIGNSFRRFYQEIQDIHQLLQMLGYWMVLIVVTQLIIEINEKYSPGVFMDILLGKYVKPKVENRIVMFIDLKDSTPMAEKLGHNKYFYFIREFIYHVSNALIEYDGRIYQYVGDEIVVSWRFNRANMKDCIKSLVAARQNLNRNGNHFRRLYGSVPEFRVGIHVGDVTVGEIGVIKKDIAMSGDTMNTTARIRSACSELNQNFIVSKEFIDNIYLENWQSESLGVVELKGKANGLELFCLKI